MKAVKLFKMHNIFQIPDDNFMVYLTSNLVQPSLKHNSMNDKNRYFLLYLTPFSVHHWNQCQMHLRFAFSLLKFMQKEIVLFCETIAAAVLKSCINIQN